MLSSPLTVPIAWRSRLARRLLHAMPGPPAAAACRLPHSSHPFLVHGPRLSVFLSRRIPITLLLSPGPLCAFRFLFGFIEVDRCFWRARDKQSFVRLCIRATMTTCRRQQPPSSPSDLSRLPWERGRKSQTHADTLGTVTSPELSPIGMHYMNFRMIQKIRS